MSDLADLFPGFASHWIDTSVGRMFARAGGSGPPLLCLHGYPQTHVMWHRVAPALARHFTLVLPDLPGYGWSAVPEAKADHAPYTKRAMADVTIEIMEGLGHARFRLAGHDRGGRVLNVSALGKNVSEARERAYAAIDRIRWPEGFCRRDIGYQAVAREANRS